MSGRKQKDSGGTGTYDVGYGKPPTQSRFAKGKSGNPNGRPKKTTASKARQGAPSGLAQLPANQMLIEEAYRMVTIREGENIVSLPAIQLMYRAMNISAMKGDRFAQRTLAGLVQQVEADECRSHDEYVEAMIKYKIDCTQTIELARQYGLPEPQVVPHPDDIFVDLRSGTVHVCGPWTDAEKRDWDRCIDSLDRAQQIVTDQAQAYRKARKPEQKEACLHMWLLAQEVYDYINDNLPRRYRKDLTDRSRAEGASKPGEQKETDWQDE